MDPCTVGGPGQTDQGGRGLVWRLGMRATNTYVRTLRSGSGLGPSGCAARKERSGTAAGLVGTCQRGIFVLPPKFTARRIHTAAVRTQRRAEEGDQQRCGAKKNGRQKGLQTKGRARERTLCSRLFPALVSLRSSADALCDPLENTRYSPPVTACLKKDQLYEIFVALAAIP